MLLLHPLPTCADAHADLAPSVLTFAPCTLSFWCYPSISQRKCSTGTHGGSHWLQLALVAFFFSHWCRHSLHWWWCHPLQLALVVIFFHPLADILHLQLSNLHCVVVYIYYSHYSKYIYIYYVLYITLSSITQLVTSCQPHTFNLHTLCKPPHQ